MAGGTRNERVIVDIIVKSQGATTALKKMDRSLKSIDKSTKDVSRNMQFFREAAGVATFAVALNQVGTEMVRIVVETQKLEKGFRAVLGSTEAAAKEMEWAREVANRLGLEYLGATNALVSLTAASKGTVLEGRATRDIFEAVSGAMSRLGRSADDTNGALKAIEQMMNKGKVTAEELKGQLGERLPGALQVAAAAMGKTTEEIFAMMEAGELMAKDFLPKFTEELNRLYEDGKQVEGLVPAWNRFKNAVSQATIALDEASGASDTLETALNGLSNGLQVVSGQGGSVEQMLTDIGEAAIALADRINPVTIAINGMAWAWGLLQDELNKPVTGFSSAGTLGVSQAMNASVGLPPRPAPSPIGSWAYAAKGGGLPGHLTRPGMTQANRKKESEAAAKAAEEATRAAEKADRSAKDAAESLNRELEKLGDNYLNLTESLDPYLEAENKRIRQLDLLQEAYTKTQAGVKGFKVTDEEYMRVQTQIIDQSVLEIAALDAKTEAGRLAAAAAKLNAEEEAALLLERKQRIENFSDDIGYAFAGAFEDIILGTESVSDAFANMAQSIAASIVKTGLTDPLAKGISGVVSGLVGGMFGSPAVTANANGNAFSGSTGLPHGVYNQPTAFPINGGGRFANGVGIMGEAGAEAILPLTRRGGKLGVEGGGAVNINVQNYAGADVQTRQGINPGDIDIIISRVADDVARGGGPVGRSIESTYGMSRGKGRR